MFLKYTNKIQILFYPMAPLDLPNMDGYTSTTNLTDAFVTICMDSSSIGKTQVVLDNLNPEWNETYRVDVCHRIDEVIFEVLDQDSVSNEKCGSAKFKARELIDGVKREDSDGYPIRSRIHKHDRGRLFLSIQFISQSDIQKGSYDIEGYFPIRKNCRVTLYQDAHVPETMPQFKTMDPPHQPACCYKDMYSAIRNAEQVICITGWSVWTELKFFRGTDTSIEKRTLGQILVDKANRGVKVYVMVWDEATTGKNNVLESVVTMGTHDEETFDYFKNTGLKSTG